MEEAAELLWAAEPTEQGRLFAQPGVLSRAHLARLRACAKYGPLSLLQAALPLCAAVDLAAYDLRPEGVRLTGARIVRMLTTVIAGRHAEIPIHRALQAVWAPKQPAASEVIRMALVLCADGS